MRSEHGIMHNLIHDETLNANVLYGADGESNFAAAEIQAANVIYGTDNDDSINGTAGDDVIYGGLGNDQIIGGAGDDTMTGGEGADMFWAGTNTDHDVITDFDGADRIMLWNIYGGWDFIQSNMHQAGDDTVITLSESSSVTLLNVDMSTIDMNDFSYLYWNF